MPNITIINDLGEEVRVAFFHAVPTHWQNHLAPGASWTTHLASLPLHFEARFTVRGEVCTQEYSQHSSQEAGVNLGIAVGAGAASVLTTAGSFLFGGLGGLLSASVSSIATVPLRNVANEHMGKFVSADILQGKIYEATVWIPFCDKTYSLRKIGDGRIVLWDIVDNRAV